MYMKENRPWGFYRVIEDSENYKVKYIYVDANKRLSLQKHFQRAEHWTIISGYAHITIGDSKRTYGPEDNVFIPKETLHRIEALGHPVEFIEIQTGSYFGEDDIIRIEDDYGRN